MAQNSSVAADEVHLGEDVPETANSDQLHLQSNGRAFGAVCLQPGLVDRTLSAAAKNSLNIEFVV